MRSAKSAKVRLDATTTLLALAGVRPVEGVEEEKSTGGEQQRSAVLLNLFLGGGDEKPIRVIEGQAREVGAPVRLAGEAVRAIVKPGSGEHGAVSEPGFAVGRVAMEPSSGRSRVWTRKRPAFAGAFLFLAQEWLVHAWHIGRKIERRAA